MLDCGFPPKETSEMDRTRQIEQAAALLREAAKPSRIILFGSHARGEADDESDVDLLVVMPAVADRISEMVRLGRILSPLRLAADILVVDEPSYQEWSVIPDSVYFEARQNGRVLYEAA